LLTSVCFSVHPVDAAMIRGDRRARLIVSFKN